MLYYNTGYPPWIVGANGTIPAPQPQSEMDKFVATDPVLQLVTGNLRGDIAAIYSGAALGVVALGAFIGARKKGGVKGGIVGGLAGAAVSTLAIELIGRYGLPGR